MKSILGTFAGLAVLAGSVYCWKFLGVDGFIAFLMGCAGISIIGASVSDNKENEMENDE